MLRVTEYFLRSFEMVPFERLVTVWYSHYIASMAVSLAVVYCGQTRSQTPHDDIGRG